MRTHALLSSHKCFLLSRSSLIMACLKNISSIAPLLLGLAAFLPINASAEETTVTESDFLVEVPKVLTASRLSQPVNQAPAAVSIIDRQMIEASGATDIAELLKLVPGFILAESSGSVYTAAYRSQGQQFTQYLQVLVDGVSAYQVYFGEVYWWTLPVPVEEIERVEVVRGPNAATYGSNAFQAVINIVTREPASYKGGQAVFKSGTHGFYRGVIRYAGGNEHVDYRATLGVKRSTGFDHLSDTTRTPFVLLRVDSHLSEADELQVQLGETDADYEDGAANSPLTPTHGAKVFDQILQARWVHSFGGGEDISLQYARSRFRHMNEWTTILPVVGNHLFSTSYQGGRDSLEFTNRLRPSRDTQLVWGIETRHDFIESPAFFYFDKSLEGDLTRLFANGQWYATSDLTIHAGAMLEKHYYTDAKWYPRIAVNYSLSPGHTLRASAAQGFRPPTFIEQKVEQRFYWGNTLLWQRFTTDPNGLQPETIISRELGYFGEWRNLALTLDARLNVDQYQNMLSIRNQSNPTALLNNTVMSFFNDYDMEVVGAELQLRWQPSKDNLVVANYSHSKILTSNQKAERSGPLNIGSLLVSHRFSPAWNGSATYYRYGSMHWLSGGDFISKYERLDLKLGYKLQPGHNNDEVALVVNNALGRHNVHLIDENRERLEAHLSLTLDF